MRRQTATSGINPAGSSRALRLDPLALPVTFDAYDTRADGGVRNIELHRERVVLRRAVHGMQMAVNVRVSDFLGVALRGIDDAQMLVLVHRDPSLTIPQGLVNHVGQGLVNHAGECRAGDVGLTSLFKRFRTRLG